MVHYLQLGPNGALPDVRHFGPYKAVVVIESEVARQRQHDISKWLVESGCLYMMAWGPNATTWDDSVDEANLEQFGFGDIPDDSCVETTWHDNETLAEVFSFSKTHATHPTQELKNTLIVHLANQDKSSALKAMYDNA